MTQPYDLITHAIAMSGPSSYDMGDAVIEALQTADYAIIKVGTVPEWMAKIVTDNPAGATLDAETYDFISGDHDYYICKDS